jgi:hypothetical protein
MVSKEAEERRQRFLAAKTAAGGSFSDLVQEVKSRKTSVYFDEAGTLMCITREPASDIDPSWNCHVFNNEQLKILEGKNWNLFYVKKDQFVDNLYSIESRPIESLYVTAEESFLSEIMVNDSSDWQVKCILTPQTFSVSLSEQVIKKYQGLPLETITAKGQKVLKFYFTALHDPHYLFHSEYIALATLVKQRVVHLPTGKDLTAGSVYTVKLFDHYQLNL